MDLMDVARGSRTDPYSRLLAFVMKYAPIKLMSSGSLKIKAHLLEH